MGRTYTLRQSVDIRWMIRGDMREVLAIEAASFERRWGEDGFLAQMRRKSTIGMVAERGERVLGYMVYTIEPTRIVLEALAVHPDHRREGVGRGLVAKLADNLCLARRTHVNLVARDSNLAAHLFLKANRFVAVDVLRGHFPDTGEDGYEFTRRIVKGGGTW